MNVLTLIDPKIMGEKHPTYGYSVWSETDSDYPVMFNVDNGNNLLPHVRVTYDEAVLKTSSKGREYLRLKKVKFEDSPVAKADVIPFTEKAAPTFEKADNAYLKDVSDLPRSIILELLKYYDVQSLYNSPKYTNLINLAQSINDDMLTMIKANRSGETSGAHPQESLKEPQAAAAPLRSAWEDRKNLPAMPSRAVSANEDYQDSDIPEEV